MRRAMEKSQLGSAVPLSLRMRFEQMCACPPGQHIWVWDGYGHNERRKDIYPAYKGNRSPTPEDIFAQIKLFRDVLRHSSAWQIEVNGWEADDVIATMAKRFKEAGIQVTVHSNDMDYAQLTRLGNVTLNGVNTKGVPARWVPLFKAMVGDSSDNIDGIPNFGPKTWERMEEHWPQIERAILNGHPAGFLGLPFTKGVATWLAVQENVDLLQSMLLVTHFYDVPEDELEGGLIAGQLDRAAGHALLGKYFL